MRKRRVCKFTNDYRRAFIIIGIILLLGVAFGALYSVYIGENRLSETNRYITELTDYSVGKIDNNNIFRTALFADFTALFAVWLFGSFSRLIPLVFAAILWKGFKTGFSVGVLLRLIGGKAIALTIFSTMLQNIIFVPFMIVLAVICIQNTIKFKNINDRRKVLKYRGTVLCMVVLTSLLCGALNGYVVPYILKPFCNMLS